MSMSLLVVDCCSGPAGLVQTSLECSATQSIAVAAAVLSAVTEAFCVCSPRHFLSVSPVINRPSYRLASRLYFLRSSHPISLQLCHSSGLQVVPASNRSLCDHPHKLLILRPHNRRDDPRTNPARIRRRILPSPPSVALAAATILLLCMCSTFLFLSSLFFFSSSFPLPIPRIYYPSPFYNSLHIKLLYSLPLRSSLLFLSCPPLLTPSSFFFTPSSPSLFFRSSTTIVSFSTFYLLSLLYILLLLSLLHFPFTTPFISTLRLSLSIESLYERLNY